MSAATQTKPGIDTRVHEYLANIDEHTLIERVPIALMKVAPYGRPVGPSQLGRMLQAGFDPRALGMPVMSMQPDGTYHIVDGNHRKHLVESQGIETMVCRVFLDLTYEEEALLYEKLNTTKPSSVLDRWRSRVERKEPSALDIAAILRGHGLHVSTTGKSHDPNGVSCVRALDYLHIQRGAEELDEVIGIIEEAWGRDKVAFTGEMIQGMGAFWARYRKVVDRKRLVAQLKKTTPFQIRKSAGLIKNVTESGPTVIGRQIRRLYIGMSTRFDVPEWSDRVQNKTSAETGHLGKKLLRKSGQAATGIRVSGRSIVSTALGEDADEAERLAADMRRRELPYGG